MSTTVRQALGTHGAGTAAAHASIVAPLMLDLDYMGDFVRGTVLLALIVPTRVLRAAYRSSVGGLAIVRSILMLRGAIVYAARSERLRDVRSGRARSSRQVAVRLML